MKLFHISKMSYESKKSWAGFGFISFWLIGFIFFFLKPTISSLVYSVSKITMLDTGFTLTFVGFTNYINAFTLNQVYPKLLTYAFGGMAYEVPTIMVFGLFMAIILNQKFRGRTFARAVFFLPVIVATGVVMKVLNGDAFTASFQTSSKISVLFTTNALNDFLLQTGINEKAVTFLTSISDNVFKLTWQSGVQILLFIAGLQGISGDLYESASMEGATAWSSFWKITFPLLSPTILLNIVFTIISSFTDYSNYLMVYIRDEARNLKISETAVYSWVYFAVIAVILFITYKIVNKLVYYENE